MFGFGKDKGEIDIKLNSFNFSPGDLIEGVVTLKVKKPVKAEGVNIAFVGEKTTVARRTNGRHGTSTQKTKVFEFKQPLDTAREYQSGEQDYSFKIKIPQNILTQGEPTSVAKAVMAIAGASGHIGWKLVANLDIRGGFDVSKTVQIIIG